MTPATLAVLRSSVNQTGLVYPTFDDDPSTSLETKLDKFAAAFKSKYGVWPAICYVPAAKITEYRGIQIKIATLTAGMFYFVAQNGGAK